MAQTSSSKGLNEELLKQLHQVANAVQVATPYDPSIYDPNLVRFEAMGSVDNNTSKGGNMSPRSKKERREQNRFDLIRFSDLEVGDTFTEDGVVMAVIGVGVQQLPDGTIKPLRTDDAHIMDLSSVTSLTLVSKRGAAGGGPTKVSFDSVILDKDKKQSIIDTIRQVDNHDLIFTEWGFSDVFEKGTAISMLFYGEPGTGKTLMAQAIADKYGYALKTLSTAEIETPEPGGAERNIKEAFGKAGEKTVILFDECDSLISSRKFMGAIMAAQVNALLTELEHYKGIAIFTTNRVGTLDEAFERRLSLKMEFEMPSAELRAKIWERMIPKKAPMHDDVDFGELSEIEIAGGHIKNIVLKAARMAANLDMPNKHKKITQDILKTALIEEVESKLAYTQAHQENGQVYGTPQAGAGNGLTGARQRVRGATRNG